MTNKIYLLIIYLNELHLWLKIGSKKINKKQLLKASYKKGQISQTKAFNDKIRNLLPEYDDDFEIVIIEIPQERISNLFKKKSEFNIDFKYISKIFPISSRGKSLLHGKIDDRIILQEPIFPEIFNELAREKEKTLSIRGADALIEIFNFSKYKNQFLKYSGVVDEALLLRESNNEKINREKPIIFNLVLYDRSKPFPNNELGYFYDLGTLLRLYENDDEVIRNTIREYAGSLDKFKNISSYSKFDSMINELHNSELIKKLEEIVKENVLVASILFLLLRGDIRESNDLEKSHLFDIVSNEFLTVHYDKELALALWLIGYFFGFEMVADLYYKRFSSEVLRFKEPFPKLKSINISLADSEDSPKKEIISEKDNSNLNDSQQEKPSSNEKAKNINKESEFDFKQ